MKDHAEASSRSGDAIAAPGEKASYPTESVEEWDGRNQVCGQRWEGDLPLAAEQPHGPQCSQQAAIKDEASREIAGIEDLWQGEEQGKVCGKLGQTGEKVEDFCAHQCPQDPEPEGLFCPAGIFSPCLTASVEVEPGCGCAQEGHEAICGERIVSQEQKRYHSIKIEHGAGVRRTTAP